MKKRLLSMALAVVMVLSLLPTTALAVDTYTVSGAVTNEKNVPISNASVRMEDYKTKEVVTTTTDSAGKYLFKDVPAGGDYTVYAEAEGYQKGMTKIRGALSRNETFVNVFLSPLAAMPYKLTVPKSTPGGTVRVKMAFVETTETTIPFKEGGNCSITCTPDKGYRITTAALTGNGGQYSKDATSFIGVLPAHDVTLSVEFEPIPKGSVTISVSPAKGGTVLTRRNNKEATTETTITYEDVLAGEPIFALAQKNDKQGYSFVEWRLDGKPVSSSDGSYEFKATGEAHQLVAYFSNGAETFAALPTDKVVDISFSIPLRVLVDKEFPLYATAVPKNAPNTKMTWSIDPGDTGSAIVGNMLQVGKKTGTIILTATIANGAGAGKDFVKTHKITVHDYERPVYGQHFDRLCLGETIYLDLSGDKDHFQRLGTLNEALPDPSLHYVPFTFMRDELTEQYPELICEYNIIHSVEWDRLKEDNLISPDVDKKAFKEYGQYYYYTTIDGGAYIGADTLPFPGNAQWDVLMRPRIITGDRLYYDGNSSILKNWYGMYSLSGMLVVNSRHITLRGYDSATGAAQAKKEVKNEHIGWRPVIACQYEYTIPRPFAGLGYLRVDAITMDLNGGSLEGKSTIKILNSDFGGLSAYRAPALEGLVPPAGKKTLFWSTTKDPVKEGGEFFSPGEIVSSNTVQKYYAQWYAPTNVYGISGTVVGSDSAAYAGFATDVTLKDSAGKVVQTVRSNDRGYYMFLGVPNGTYTVEARYPGYYPTVITAKVDNKNARVVRVTMPKDASYVAPSAPKDRAEAAPTYTKMMVNGKSISVTGYVINQNNYIKLRDLAYIINGTGKNFEVQWDGEKKAINLLSGKPYTPTPSDMQPHEKSQNQMAELSTAGIYVNGAPAQLTAYLIGQSNYFKLRDVMQTFDVYVGWDQATSTVSLDTGRSYEVPGETAPVVNTTPKTPAHVDTDGTVQGMPDATPSATPSTKPGTGTSPSATNEKLADGTYKIVPASASGFDVCIGAASKNDNAALILWKRGDGDHRQFKITSVGDGKYTMTLVHSGKKVTTDSQQGSGVYQGTGSYFIITKQSDGTYRIQDNASRLYLGVSGGKMENDSRLVLWAKSDDGSQAFVLKKQ